MTLAPPVALPLAMGTTASTPPNAGWLLTAWRAARHAGAADLHLTSHAVPQVRCQGRLQPLDGLPPCPPPPWSGLATLLGRAEDDPLLQDHDLRADPVPGGPAGEAEGSLALPGLGRARWSLARQQCGLMLVLRLIREDIPSLAALQLTPAQAALMQSSHGLLLVSGATGSGKSSTLAALVQHWRQQQSGHVLTLEDPIEFIYPAADSASAGGLVSQREIGRDCAGFAHGLRAALRQDPDVILIGELRDHDTARLALTAAETGHLVLATLHAATAIGTIDRLLSLFPAAEQALARALLAESLIAVMAQQLLWRGDQARACREVMVATPAIRHLIREHRLAQIESAMQTGVEAGMQTRARALAGLRAEGFSG